MVVDLEVGMRITGQGDFVRQTLVPDVDLIVYPTRGVLGVFARPRERYRGQLPSPSHSPIQSVAFDQADHVGSDADFAGIIL
jgi:hypothetical protein